MLNVKADLIQAAAAVEYGDVQVAEKLVARVVNKTGKQWLSPPLELPKNNVLSACGQARQSERPLS